MTTLSITESTTADDAVAEVKRWVDAEVPARWRSAAADGANALRAVRSKDDYRQWYPVFARSGLVVPTWMPEHGGLGVSSEVARAIESVLRPLRLARLNPLGLNNTAAALFSHGTEEQRRRFLPPIVGNEEKWCQLFSEPGAGSDLASLATRAVRDGEDWVVTGTKAWITHGGQADFYNIFCRTGGPGPSGISCLLADADTPGLLPQRPEDTMGLRASPPAQVVFDRARVPAERLIGAEGEGFRIAMQALDAGRLGIAACAVGLAQAALDHAAAYAGERTQFGRLIGDFQGVGFMLADMATQISAARALTLAAARLKDAGRPFSTEAAKAKLFATDMAMRVTTDAVQVLGGAGYVADHPVERWFREAKVLQIVEGTNQIQRMVISRALTRGRTAAQ